jgi:hypothetical protein
MKLLQNRSRLRALFLQSSLLAFLSPALLSPCTLDTSTSKAWKEQVERTERLMAQRLLPGRPFLWVDEDPSRLARVRAGETVVSPVGEESPSRIHGGMIHDWVGAIFIPNATLSRVLQVVRSYDAYKEVYTPSVKDSKAIAIGANQDRFSLLLFNRSFFSKTAFDAEYETQYFDLDNQRGYSTSRTTRIQEVASFGESNQHELQEGEGTGIIWQLFTVSRYAERDGGVYLEIEALGLSRDVPVSVRWLVLPIIRRVSREALSLTLEQTVGAVAHCHARNGGIAAAPVLRQDPGNGDVALGRRR